MKERDGPGMKKTLVAGAAAVVLVTGIAAMVRIATAAEPKAATSAKAVSAPTQVDYTPPPITWRECFNDTISSFEAQCGWLVVPLDYSKPTGTKIQIAVSRVSRLKGVPYQGVMLTQTGDPGEPGQGLATSGYDGYDGIGFDPRGVGESEPSLICNGRYFGYDRPAYVPSTAKLESAWLKKAKGYSAACAKAKGAALLDHVKTIDTAYDMDSLRKALGVSQINYYGSSYGTYLGQVYSTLFPTRVRRMVLDGVVDPTRVWYAADLDRDAALDRNLNVFFAWIAKKNKIYHVGTTESAVERLYYSTQAKLDEKPAGGKIGGDELHDIFLGALGSMSWEAVARDYANYIHKGDWKTLVEEYDFYAHRGVLEPPGDNWFAMYLATRCTDVQWPRSWAEWKADMNATYQKAPFATWSSAWYNAPCRTWAGKAGTPVKVDGAAAPAILLISETKDTDTPYSRALKLRSRYPQEAVNDPDTTYSGALKVRSLYPKSVLVEYPAEWVSSDVTSCAERTIETYLATGRLPARVAGNTSDLQCPPSPQPKPKPRVSG